MSNFNALQDKITALKKLHEDGLITREEYKEKVLKLIEKSSN